jgi:hypothetical protein
MINKFMSCHTVPIDEKTLINYISQILSISFCNMCSKKRKFSSLIGFSEILFNDENWILFDWNFRLFILGHNWWLFLCLAYLLQWPEKQLSGNINNNFYFQLPNFSFVNENQILRKWQIYRSFITDGLNQKLDNMYGYTYTSSLIDWKWNGYIIWN